MNYQHPIDWLERIETQSLPKQECWVSFLKSTYYCGAHCGSLLRSLLNVILGGSSG